MKAHICIFSFINSKVEKTQDDDFKGRVTPLVGSMPSEIGLLKSLESLIISDMKLSGSILNYIKGATNLTVLDVHSNTFTGSIPDSFSQEHPALINLNLALNQFTGAIPTSIGTFTSLKTLNLQFNQIKGKLPSELAGIPTLRKYHSKCFYWSLSVFLLHIYMFVLRILGRW